MAERNVVEYEIRVRAESPGGSQGLSDHRQALVEAIEELDFVEETLFEAVPDPYFEE